jgi:hypothetical protein
MVFSKVFPIVAIYEIHEYERELAKHAKMEELYDEAKNIGKAIAAD